MNNNSTRKLKKKKANVHSITYNNDKEHMQITKRI
jgi:hypothetical protein